MIVGPVNRAEMSALSVSLRASLARRFLATLTCPPADFICLRSCSISATVRPAFRATTIDPAPAREAWSAVTSSRFSALSNSVSTLARQTVPDRCQLLPPCPPKKANKGDSGLIACQPAPERGFPRAATGLVRTNESAQEGRPNWSSPRLLQAIKPYRAPAVSDRTSPVVVAHGRHPGGEPPGISCAAA